MSAATTTLPTANSLIIGVSQQEPNPLDVNGTLSRLSRTAEQAALWDVQILALPEMSVTGYNITAKEIAHVAEASDGPIFQSIAKLCQTHKLAILYGYAETDGNGNYFNSAQLIDEHGNSLLNYHKTHLWGALDRSLFQPGASLSPVIQVCGWNLGVAICYDAEFPETLRHLVVHGAELAIVPTGLMSPWTEVAEQVIPVRAYENRMFVAYANYCGDERDLSYVGHSCIADPNGQVLASGKSEPVLLTATLERNVLANARTSLPYLTERRPELYDAINQPLSHLNPEKSR